MSYQKCIKLAGANVLLFKEFGSYQGDWWAKVEYNNKTGWINGSYGSCSGCDAFLGEFDFDSHEHKDNSYVNYYDMPEQYKENCIECQDLVKRMKEFGKSYLDDIMTQEKAEIEASKNLEWDLDAQEMFDYIKNNKI